MRSPSSRVLANTVDIYAAAPGQDLGGGVQYIYPAYPTMKGVPCSVQAGSVTEIMENDRITQKREYRVMFGSSIQVSARDRMIYTDSAGIQHILSEHIVRDEAGRGAAFVVYAVERT